MKAWSSMTVILGDETRMEARASRRRLPLGYVKIEFGEDSDLVVQASSPGPLLALADAFTAAGNRLRRLIDEQGSALGAHIPGADALDEAALSVEGEQPHPAVAAPPSSLDRPVEFIEHGSKFDRSLSEMDAGL